ncbi:unnamed protein product [Darwinula stevensoni]|uniref:Phosphoribosylformylglycinamidine synthase n=1 Tax=Darwinula stevensoni TaxID=69355 RepID=A0A7R8XC47_9CRUS|nr:unnamed protein product [Darwinula stevensoni]CAG0892990.1 unnamed protein product [Darwinula stevensoni]
MLMSADCNRDEMLLQYYIKPDRSIIERKRQILQIHNIEVQGIELEFHYYIKCSSQVSSTAKENLHWILQELECSEVTACLGTSSTLGADDGDVFEIGPRLNFSTPFSTNVISICKAIGLTSISRVERFLCYSLSFNRGSAKKLLEKVGIPDPSKSATLYIQINSFHGNAKEILHDRMTECVYEKSLSSLNLPHEKEPWYEVPVLEKGKAALEEIGGKLGLAFDSWDLEHYTRLFTEKLQRNPTSVECFDLAQSNSEHSRHWFFKGQLIIDGHEAPASLLEMIIATQESTSPNNVVKFSDNSRQVKSLLLSSAIEGYAVKKLLPESPAAASPYKLVEGRRHIIFTAETHNFPTGVSPFSGAATGTGGRIRDVQAIGRGGHVIAGTAGYCFGNLHIPGYPLDWEDSNWEYPPNFASPLDVAIQASNGASDYGNKFGEPVIAGFTRSFGMILPDSQRREWIKPIMFSGGIGSVDAEFVFKVPPSKGMAVVKLGGPVYRIGVGGGSASSIQVQGENAAELDYGAVQRGDPEMEQKLNRVIRACLELPQNPILSIHDQGAGGNGNVLKEISDPAGALLNADRFTLGDSSISILELWGAEYQESNAILCHEGDLALLQDICIREQCPLDHVGGITGDGKVFNLDSRPTLLGPLSLPMQLKTLEALGLVLRLPSVCSKRFLTNKVDRSVTGLVAQQQCTGPFHIPLADMGVIALSYSDLKGAATAIGEQPIKCLVDPEAGARMSLGEALSNLVFAPITSLQDVKCSGNWMWAAKLEGEGANMYQACRALCGLMAELGVAIDGGKDSLSMAARVNDSVVKAPGSIVVSAYAPCPHIDHVITPDLKSPIQGQTGHLILVRPQKDEMNCRLGGSALAQCFKQVGDAIPDVDCPAALRQAFSVTQKLIKEGLILSGHDVSDGGLITCLLEMAFAGYSGFAVDIPCFSNSTIDVLFSEELSWVLEVSSQDEEQVLEQFQRANVPVFPIGKTMDFGKNSHVKVTVDSELVLDVPMVELLKIWEETSYQLERLQCNPLCADAEYQSHAERELPAYNLTFTACHISPGARVPKVAVIREQGSNGDRELSMAFLMEGFEVWDVTTFDLIEGHVTLDHFHGLAFPGGFSYADVLGSAKGWAASLMLHSNVKAQLDQFFCQEDKFSLGICNGCQLMAMLGWLSSSPQGGREGPEVLLKENVSGRFESRFVSVRIEKSPSVLLQGMEGSILGVWVAHGEGRFTFRDPLGKGKLGKCIALRYTDDSGRPTECYPMNPNGSPGTLRFSHSKPRKTIFNKPLPFDVGGVGGMCSPCGRHLALMPHPERCIQFWQWPWIPPTWDTAAPSPWRRLFQNAFIWSSKHLQDFP